MNIEKMVKEAAMRRLGIRGERRIVVVASPVKERSDQMTFKSFSFKWWWYGIVEDLHAACEKELHDLEEKEHQKGHDWLTPKDSLPHGWYSVAMDSLSDGKELTISAPYHCIWESPQHIAIRSLYAGKIFQRHISFIPQCVGTLGGLAGIASIIMQCIK
jgi:hypothetical protein